MVRKKAGADRKSITPEEFDALVNEAVRDLPGRHGAEHKVRPGNEGTWTSDGNPHLPIPTPGFFLRAEKVLSEHHERYEIQWR